MEDEQKVTDIDVNIHLKVNFQSPSLLLYEFDGYLNFYDEEDAHLKDSPIGLDSKNLLLKGAKLKNTQWALGLTLYTGKDTKVQKNSSTISLKTTKLEKLLHKIVIRLFLIQLVLSIIGGFGKPLLMSILNLDFNLYEYAAFTGYHPFSSYDLLGNVLDGCRYFLLLNTFIPISLVVNLEVVRLFQVAFMR